MRLLLRNQAHDKSLIESLHGTSVAKAAIKSHNKSDAKKRFSGAYLDLSILFYTFVGSQNVQFITFISVPSTVKKYTRLVGKYVM